MAGNRALCGLLLAVCCLRVDAQSQTLCQVSTWSTWTDCSTTCGRGMMSRHRAITSRGRECPALAESKECLTQRCPVDCKMGEPSKWSVCSKSCGGGFEMRRRSISREPLYGGKACPDHQEFRYCNKHDCPLDCKMSEWEAWGPCTKSCGGGTRSTKRSVVQQKAFGGRSCPASKKVGQCNTQACVIACEVSPWNLEQPCTRSCGTGYEKRKRRVTREAENGGKQCPVLIKYNRCNTHECPIDCIVSEFSDFGECDKSCGGGMRVRHRSALVTNAYGGKECPALKDEETCETSNCPRDCQVTKFGDWSECSLTCGAGTQKQQRSIRVRAAFGGKHCPHLVEARRCNKHECPIDCIMSKFDSWEACDVTCGGGTQWRGRTILQPSMYGGIACPAKEHHKQLRACNEQDCPVDCVLTKWSAWTACTKSCSGGSRTRTRSIVSQPETGGKKCPKNMVAKQVCNGQCCSGTGEDEHGVCKICPAGRFAGKNNKCNKCKKGMYSDKDGMNQCKTCAFGSYADKWGMSSCNKCTAGTFAPESADQTKNSCKSCTSGTGSEEGATECETCKPGHFSEGESKCLRCADGTAQAKAGMHKCDTCGAGHYSNTEIGLTKCETCKPGTYSAAAGAAECAECPKGQFSREAQQGCSQCEAGKFHASGFSNFLYAIGWHGQKCVDYELCGLGKELAGHSVNKNGKCMDCLENEYQPIANKWDAECLTCGNCPKGEQRVGCAKGSAGSCKVCPVGTFKADASYEACQLCPVGKFAKKSGSNSCMKCPAGFIADQGAGQCTACPAGTYNKKADNHCTTCGAGTYSASGSSKCKACAKGYYSDAGDPSCTACLAGTYGEGSVQDSGYCVGCPQGKFQSASGMTKCDNCAPGQHSKSLTTVMDSCVECNAGKYQDMPEAHLCKTCAEGTYTNLPGQEKCDSCPSCPTLGDFRKGCGLTQGGTCTQCPQGTYSQLWKCGDHEACPVGKFGARHEKVCHTCPNGKYKDAFNTAECSQCQVCPAGHMRIGCTSESAGTCVACGEGTYKSAPIDWDSGCLVCPKGSYTEEHATRMCKACPAGKHQSGTSAESAMACKQCAAGTFAASTGTVTCTACAMGKFQRDDGAVSCNDCAHGTFNEATGSTTECGKCPAGKFHVTSEVACTGCAKGTYMENAGHYVAPGADSPCDVCPGGKFSGAEASVCEGCKAGTYESGDRTGCIHCPKGQFQASDLATECVHCESGKHMAFHGSTECKDCPAPLPTSDVWPVQRFFWTANLAGAEQCSRKPLDCLSGSWSSWSTCTTTCGGGKQGRTRPKVHEGWGGGLSCTEVDFTEERNCNTHDCPVDCEVTSWNEWEQCSAPCGTGRQTRARMVKVHPAEGGKACPVLVSPPRPCNTHQCKCKAMTCEYKEHAGMPGVYSVHVTHGIGKLINPEKYGFKKGQTSGFAADYFTNDGIHHCKYNKVTDTCSCTCPSLYSETYVNHLAPIPRKALTQWRPTNHNHAAWAAPGKVWPEWHALFHSDGAHHGLGTKKDGKIKNAYDWRAYHVPTSSAYRARIAAESSA